MSRAPVIHQSRKNPIQKLYAYASDVDKGPGQAYAALASLPFDAMCRAARDLRRTLPANNAVFGKIYAKDYADLCDWSNIYYSDHPRQDIYIAAAEVRAFADVLNEFVPLEEELDGLVLSGEFDAALSLLQRIEVRFGLSLWSLSNRFALLELTSGVDAQKAFASEIRKREDVASALRTFSYFFSLKAERAVSPARYHAAVAKSFTAEGKDSYSSVSYFNFHTGFYSNSEITNLAAILVYERGSPLIDRYLTFIRVAQLATIISNQQKLLPHFQHAIRALGDKIRDDRIEALLMKLNAANRIGKNFLEERSDSVRSYLSIVDDYTKGNYECVRDTIDRLPHREKASLTDLYCRCATRVADAGRGFSLVREHLAELLIKSAQSNRAFDQLIKSVHMFGYSRWAVQVFAVACHETSATGTNYREGTLELGLLNGAAASPRLHAALFGAHASDRLVAKSFTYRFLAFRPNGDSLLSAGERDLIPHTRAVRYQAGAMKQSGDLDGAIRALNVLKASTVKVDLIDSLAITSSLLTFNLEKGDVLAAARVAAEALCNRPQLSARLQLGEVIYLNNELSSQGGLVSGDIYMTVCYGLLNEYYTTAFEGDIPIRCEQFLLSIGVDRPSAMRSRLNDISTEVMAFFLYAMCKPEIIDSHIAYETPSDVLDERVLILQWLIELDERRRSIYADEIAQITQKQLIRKGVQAIEKSRIQVDVEGIRNSLDKDFTELYTRFMTLPQEIAPYSDVVIRLARDHEHGGVVLVLPRNERYSALLQIVQLVRERFVSSNEHGLDVYLSVGIRHGTLSGQLRSVLEKWHLTSQKGRAGDYDSNEYWTKCLAEDSVSAEEINRMDQALRTLSQSVDDLIAKLRDKWVQIRTEDKNHDGFFNFTVTNQEVLEIGRAIDLSKSSANALDLLFDFLWRKTDASLLNLRSVLKADFKTEFSGTIDVCLTEIGSVVEVPSIQRLRTALLRARTDVQSEIDDIAEWFTRNSEVDVSDYQFDFAVDVAQEMVRRCYPQHTLHLSRASERPLTLPGSTLKGVVEIFFIALDNMLKHCGKSEGVVSAKIIRQQACNSMDIELSSIVAHPVNVIDENQKLKQRLQLVLADETTDTVRREGGSGFFKIAKIIRIDFASTLKLWFGYTSPNEFSLKIGVTGGSPFDENFSG
ncbi:hypothetical protein [Caballeronia sp. AZ1_KS37]|uniref:hypothetical protein n=1 Tax=Caballeronia sp. AZ1_KS37 TaxID=2921756 RepID=UPI0020279C60|nr:hypothetical protein [Caballeronia sp. AZ1_KS37]